MGKRGPTPKPGVRLRPLLTLPDAQASEALALGPAELSRLITWALPRYPLRRAGDAPSTDPRVVLQPATPRTPQPARIWTDEAGTHLHAWLPERDDRFRDVVKAEHLEWDATRRRWSRTLGPRDGSPSDRVAELASLLFTAGFAVTVDNAALADLLLRGTWRPRQRRWVTALPDGHLLITWEQGGDDVYAATGVLGGARWDKARQGSVISSAHHAALRDFAQEFAFTITDGALALLEQAERDERARLLVQGPLPAPLQPARKRRAARTQEVSIPHDLLADDD